MTSFLNLYALITSSNRWRSFILRLRILLYNITFEKSFLFIAFCSLFIFIFSFECISYKVFFFILKCKFILVGVFSVRWIDDQISRKYCLIERFKIFRLNLHTMWEFGSSIIFSFGIWKCWDGVATIWFNSGTLKALVVLFWYFLFQLLLLFFFLWLVNVYSVFSWTHTS